MPYQTNDLRKALPPLPATMMLVMTVASAWYFGSAPWQAQLPLLVLSLLVSIGFAVSQVRTGMTWTVNPFISRYWMVGIAFAVITIFQCCPIPNFLTGTPLSQGHDLKSKYLVTSPQLENDAATAAAKSSPTTNSLSAAPANSYPYSTNYRTWTNSIDPIHSLAALGSIGLFLLALLSSYRAASRTPQWIYPLLIVLMVNGAAMASVGIIEKLTPNGWRLLETSSSSTFGGFVSRSSAAAFLNIGLAAAVGCFVLQSRIDHKYQINPSYRSDERGVFSQLRLQLEESVSEISTQKVLILVSAILMFIGILMSLSRGGAISAFAAMLSLLVVNLFRKNLIASVAMVILVLFSSLFTLRMLDKLEIVRDRLETISEGNVIIDNGRWQAWGYAIDTSRDLWLTGGGLGNFHYSYLPYQTQPGEAWYYHAESLYLQTLSDMGAIGFLGLMILVTTLATPIRNLMSQAKYSIGKAVGSTLMYLTISLGIHSISDFSIIIPALYLPAALIIGVCFATLDLKVVSSSKSRRRMRSSSKSKDNQNFKLRISHPQAWSSLYLFAPTLMMLLGIIFVRPKSAAESLNNQVERWSVSLESAKDDLDDILADGERQLAKFPHEGELNMAMAKAYTKLYRLSVRDQRKLTWEQTLPIYARESFYQRSRIESLNVDELLQNPVASEALKKARECWLRAHYALPMDWRPHWGLVELDFVTADQSTSTAHLERLRILARNRPDLLLTAGISALDFPGPESSFPILKQVAVDYIRRAPAVLKIAYRAYRDRAFSDEFLPSNSSTLRHLSETIQTVNAPPNSLKIFWDTVYQRAQQLPNEDKNKSTLLAYYYHETGDVENEYTTLSEAVSRSPMNTNTRYLLAKNLLLRKEFDQAETHIEFCLRQEPAKKEFLQLKEELARQRVPLPDIKPQ